MISAPALRRGWLDSRSWAATRLGRPTVLRVAAPVVVLGVLGLAVANALGRLPGGAALIGTGLGALVAVSLVLRRLEWGVVFLSPIAVLVPFSVGTGTGSPIVAALMMGALLVALWCVRMLTRGELSIRRSPMNLPLALFLVSASISSINMWVMLDPLVVVWESFIRVQAGGLGVFFLSAGVLLVTANTLREARWLRWLVWVYLAMSAAILLIYFVQGRQDPKGSETGGLFSLWAISLAFGQALFNRSLSRWARTMLLVLVVAWMVRRFFFENDWMSGWAPAGLALATIAFLKSWRTLAGLVGVGILIGALNLPLIQAFYEVQTAGSAAQGNSERLGIWSQNLELTQDHLLLGTGVAGYALYYMSYFPNTARSSHSNYLDIFAQTGLLGSALFAAFWIAVVRAAFTARRVSRSGFALGYSTAALGATVGILVAMALGDWVIPFVYNATIGGFRFTVHTWVFLGGLIALTHLESEGGAST